MNQLPRGDVNDVSQLRVGEPGKVPQQDQRSSFQWQGRQRSLDGVTAQGTAGFGLWKTLQVHMRATVPAKPSPGAERLPAELGGRSKYLGALEAVEPTVAHPFGNLSEGGAANAGGRVRVIDQARDVIQNQGEVRVELAFHGRRPRVRGWSFDVNLFHYWDVERMPAV
jgi:hypothetical protein